MKKTIRLLTSLLVLLALLVSLPISAMADIDENTALNDQDGVTIIGGVTVDVNTGDNVTNNGQINTNQRTVTDNVQIPEGNWATHGEIETNNGKVMNNGKEGGGEFSGSITRNEAVLEGESYKKDTGLVENNYGSIGNNGIKDKGETSGTVDKNYGKIGSNYGTVTDNIKDSTIHENAAGGVVKDNNGTVTKNFGNVETNTSTGSVGIFETDEEGEVSIREGGNYGKIETNNGFVLENGGYVWNDETKESEELAGTITTNKGTVQNNNILGEIDTNATGAKVIGNNGTIDKNFGEVTNNNGVVTNKSGGEVVFNQGTVHNEAGGIINEYKIEGDMPEPQSNEEPGITPSKTITGEGTYYGVTVEKEGYDEEAVEAGTWTFGYALLQKKKGEALDLRNIFTKTGYEVFGYMYEDENYDEVEVNSTTYNDDKPGYLALLWRKIQEIIAPAPAAPTAPSSEPEVKPVKAAAIPTTVAAEDVKVGTTVRAKGQTFKVIEMDDGSILVATVGKLSKKDIEDMKAFLAKYFTPEQIEKLLGDPELLSDELVAKYFGGNIEHISFRAAKDLFAQ